MQGTSSWASSPAVHSSMRSNRGRDTSLEMSVRREVHRRGMRYFVNRRPVPELRRTADLIFPRIKLAVCLDGCFWHGCPDHHTVAKTNARFWADKVFTNRTRDFETTMLWEEAGWVVLRFWEHEAPGAIADQIYKAVTSRLTDLNVSPPSSSVPGVG